MGVPGLRPSEKWANAPPQLADDAGEGEAGEGRRLMGTFYLALLPSKVGILSVYTYFLKLGEIRISDPTTP